MGRPDALLRWADHPRGADDNVDFTLLTLEVFELRAMEAVTLEGEEAIFMERIQQSNQFDEPVVKALKALDVGELCSDEWTHTEGIVLYRGKVYIQDNPQLHHNLVHAHHSATVARHPRCWKMLELVSWNYWWPGLSRYIAKFVTGCNVCNQMKTFPMQKVGKLVPNKVPDQCWQVISVDMIRELLDSKGYNAVLVVVDRLSKQIHAIPTVTSLDSAGVTQLFLEHIWRHHGLPEEVISDHRSTFISNFSRKLAALLGVKLTPSTSYHPQTDGQTEHVNQEIEAYLRVFMSHQQDDWADWLPLAEFAYNNKVHTATCWTPFKLDTRQHPCLGVEPMRTSTIEAVDAFAQQLDHAQEEAKAALEQVADDMKQYYGQNHQVAPEYKVGDKAWLSLQNYSSNRPMKKLDHKWAGPFTITKVISPAAIKLHLSAREKNIPPIISISSVCPYILDEIVEHPQPLQPGPITVDNQEEYKVEEILDSRFRWGKLWYLVKLIGWSHSDNMWLPHSGVHAPAVVEEFHLQHPDSPHSSSPSTLTTSHCP